MCESNDKKCIAYAQHIHTYAINELVCNIKVSCAKIPHKRMRLRRSTSTVVEWRTQCADKPRPKASVVHSACLYCNVAVSCVYSVYIFTRLTLENPFYTATLLHRILYFTRAPHLKRNIASIRLFTPPINSTNYQWSTKSESHVPLIGNDLGESSSIRAQ